MGLHKGRGYFAPTGEELQGLELLNRLVEAVPTPVYMIQLDDHPGYTVADAHLTKLVYIRNLVCPGIIDLIDLTLRSIPHSRPWPQ
jgi:hypothetical protein